MVGIIVAIMPIRIDTSQYLFADTKKNVIFHMTNNTVMQWTFFAIDEDWSCIYTGSFRQACFVARKMYNRKFNTYYGQLLVTDLKLVTVSVKISGQKSQQTFNF